MRVSCIGSRTLNPEQLNICFQLGNFIARCRGLLNSGNGDGADQAFAKGANSVNPESVHLHLPWPSFNREAIVEGNVVHLPLARNRFEEIAAEYHPRWENLAQGARKLHTRNVSIVVWPTMSDLVLAFPSQKLGGGGTGQGIRVAKGLGIEVVDLNGMTRAELFDLCERMRSL